MPGAAAAWLLTDLPATARATEMRSQRTRSRGVMDGTASPRQLVSATGNPDFLRDTVGTSRRERVLVQGVINTS